ncbi:helix-turn-helix transcriptional regulator [Paenibacillus monticola]|uniref:WYL domain-containing protein n=1 Tax=Paenibacillus monticola TaxID=2666075 RepID=A0A7X2H6M9_9BACL|nr:WYL domain-containing protein [Paenibacillus monticola]MRN54492.1 WYL domain-containing protein [Paenibacillus monticola]
MRLHRLIAILLLIESRGRMKAHELALALETSVRSIYRDIDVLAEAGIPMVTTPGPQGGISLMEGYTVNLKQLHGEEVINLYLTGMGMYAGGGHESAVKLNNTLLKLEKTLPANYQIDVEKAKHRFYYDDTPWWTERIAIPCLEAVRTAVWNSRKIIIQYSKVNGDSSSRTLHPYGLVVKKMDWYLVAFCEGAGQLRTFKCERITSVKLTDEHYLIPAEFTLEEHWKDRERSFKQTRSEEEVYPVVLRTDRMNKDLLNRLEVTETVTDGAQLILTVNMYSYERACSDIMHIISQAEIVEPLELRQYIVGKLRVLQKVYR